MPRKGKPKSANTAVNALWPIIQLAAGLPNDETSRKRIAASKQRMVEARRQMEQHTGPLYDISVSRSQVISDAYRAAGSPPKPRGPAFQLSETGALERVDTPEWRAWRAWLPVRERLRRDLGIQRGKATRFDPNADPNRGA
jgi:hypothetical protein